MELVGKLGQGWRAASGSGCWKAWRSPAATMVWWPWHVGERVPGPMHPAPLPGGAEHPRIAAKPSCASEITSLMPVSPRLTKSPGSRSRRSPPPRTDVQPDDLAPALGCDRNSDYDGDRDDAAAFPHFEVGGIEPQIRPSPVSGRCRKPVTRSSMSLQSLDTGLRDAAQAHGLDQIVDPAGQTPAIQASWITATSAFSTVRRGSRKPGK